MKFSAIIPLLAVGQARAFVPARSSFSNTICSTSKNSPSLLFKAVPLRTVASPPVSSRVTLSATDDDKVAAAKTDEAAPKQEKKPKKKPPPPHVVEIDVSKLDIRVGLIIKAWEHEEADKLYCEDIDLGEESGPRKIASGLKAHYSLEDLEGRKILVLANLKTRKLVGFPSHGMVLCAVNDDDKVVFVDPPEGAEIGERVMVEGFDGEPATENQVIKKKMLDAIFPDLKTNADGVATYRGKALTTSAGDCTSGLSNAIIS